MDLSNYIFLNIETITEYPNLQSLESANKLAKSIWDANSIKFRSSEDLQCTFDEYPLYKKIGNKFPDFSKIISVSIGFIDSDSLIIKTIISESEYEIINKLNDFLNSFANRQFLCGYDIKKFIIPFLSKRFVYHGFSIPRLFINDQIDDISSRINLDCHDFMKSSLELIMSNVNFITPHVIEFVPENNFNEKYHNENDLNFVKSYSENHLAQSVNLFLTILGERRILKFN
jgi:DNA polymerase elongation subunit (family B)